MERGKEEREKEEEVKHTLKLSDSSSTSHAK